jgi:hypothetical protein
MVAMDAVLKQLEQVCALPNQKKNGKNKGICSNLSIIKRMPLFIAFLGPWADFSRDIKDGKTCIST